MSESFEIQIPAVLALKVIRFMNEQKCSLDEAFFILVEKVCTPNK